MGTRLNDESKQELKQIQEKFDAGIAQIKEKIRKERNISKKLEELLVSEINKTSRMDQ